MFPLERLSRRVASILRMAVDGIGIGVMPLAVVQAELAAGRLVLLRVDHGLPPPRFTATYLATAVAGLAATVADVAGHVASTL